MSWRTHRGDGWTVDHLDGTATYLWVTDGPVGVRVRVADVDALVVALLDGRRAPRRSGSVEWPHPFRVDANARCLTCGLLGEDEDSTGRVFAGFFDGWHALPIHRREGRS